jgi:NAD(P)-dependent dehydrogenase (short-subunit alcohol dehydrogenase family)
MSSARELEGRRALVTGASKGIGRAVALELREAGATVLTTARSHPADLPSGEHFVAADVTRTEGCSAIADAVQNRLGGVDIVVHVVGGSSAPAGGFAVLTLSATRSIPASSPRATRRRAPRARCSRLPEPVR